MNGCPMRVAFLTTNEAKERLAPALFDGNVRRVASAPVVAIIGQDMEFFEYLPHLYPHAPENKKIFEENEFAALTTAFSNSAVGCFIMAARALGQMSSGMHAMRSRGSAWRTRILPTSGPLPRVINSESGSTALDVLAAMSFVQAKNHRCQLSKVLPTQISDLSLVRQTRRRMTAISASQLKFQTYPRAAPRIS